MGGFWGAFGWATCIIINAEEGVGLGTITFSWLRCCTTRGAPILTLAGFSGTGNFSSGVTLHYNISLFCKHLAPSGVHITYDLGVFSPGMIITVAGCHRLILGAFCSHSGCWGSNSGSFLGMSIMTSIFLPLEKTLPHLFTVIVGSGDCLGGCFVLSVSQKLCRGRYTIP